jgi:hypothetical protein
MRKVPLAPDVKPDIIARGCPGFSGADLANLVNEAALFAARKNKRLVDMDDFEMAKDKIIMGAERRSMVMPEEERRNTAYHESGHTIVARMLPKTDPVHKVTVIPRGRALGVTMQLPTEDRYSQDRERLLSMIAVLFGGRIAEELFMNQMTTGASNDFERATEIARRMVTQWGMSDELGTMVYGENEGEVFLGRSVTTHKSVSEATMQKVDAEIRRIIDQQYRVARKILEENREKVEVMAKAAARVRDARRRPDRRHHVRQAAAAAQAERLAERGQAAGQRWRHRGRDRTCSDRLRSCVAGSSSFRSSVPWSWAWSTSRPIPFPTAAASSRRSSRSRTRASWRARAPTSSTSAANPTRPGAAPVSEQDELARVLPVLTGDRRPLRVGRHPPSGGDARGAGSRRLDDQRRGRARRARRAGSGGEKRVRVCLMHKKGDPATMQQDPHYDDVVGEVKAFLKERVNAAQGAGIGPERITVDPGLRLRQDARAQPRAAAPAVRAVRLPAGGGPVAQIHARQAHRPPGGRAPRRQPRRWLCWRCRAARQYCACMT